MVEGNGSSEKIFNQGYKYIFARALARAALSRGHPRSRDCTRTRGRRRSPSSPPTISSRSRSRRARRTTRRATGSPSCTTTSIRQTRPTSLRSSVRSRRRTRTSSSTAAICRTRCCCRRGSRSRTSLAKAYGYSVGPDTPDFRKALGNDANVVFGGTQWSPTAKYRGAPGFIADSKTYAKAFEAKYGHVPDYHNAESTADVPRLPIRDRSTPVRSIRRRCATRSRG